MIDDILSLDEEALANLTEDEQLQLEKDLTQLIGGETAQEFIARVWDWEPPPEHLLPIIDLVQLARIQQIRVCLSMPPGHSKTTTLIRLIIWWLSRSPTDTCAYVTYNDHQALRKSRTARAFAGRAGLTIPASSSALSEWRIHTGGGLLVGGARSGLMGNRIPGLLIYDDPYKDAKDALSPVIRETVRENFKVVAFTRLQGGSIIVLHTRYHEDDLIGWLVRELHWPVINVPAYSQGGLPDALHREPGMAAWPSHYPYERCPSVCGHDGHLMEIRETIGEHWWHALYQGTPRTIGKSVFHEPARYSGWGQKFNWEGKRGVIAIDPAATAKTSSDWSVLLVCAMEGYGVDTRMWIVDCIRVQQEIPQLVRTAKDLQKRYRLLIACEAVAGFKAVPQMLRDQDPTLRVIDINVGGRDKFTRSQPVAAAWNTGRVLVPADRDCHWADTFINEHRLFSGLGDACDDQVDADGHAWNTLYREKKVDKRAWHEALI